MAGHARRRRAIPGRAAAPGTASRADDRPLRTAHAQLPILLRGLCPNSFKNMKNPILQVLLSNPAKVCAYVPVLAIYD